MAPRAPIIAGQTVILVRVQDTVDQALKTIRSKLQRFSSTLSSISFDLFRGGLVGTLPEGLLLRTFKTYEDEILFLETKLKGANLDIPFAEVVDKVKELGRTTTFTTGEVAAASSALAQAGFSATRLRDSLQAVLDLAKGARIELPAAAAILANTMTVFDIEGTKANEVASQFIVAARSGTLNVLDLKESLKEVVGTFRTLNIDLPTSLALITQLARSSLKGTKAGTSLNTALLNLASKQNVLRDALGIEINDPGGNLRPFIDILEELDNKLSKLGDSQRLAVVQRLFNIRGGRAITALQDIKNIRRLAGEIANAGDEAREAAKKMDSGFTGAVKRATSAIEGLALEMGKILAGPLGKFLRTLAEIANNLRDVVIANPNTVLLIAAIPPAMLAIGVAGITAAFALSKLAGIVGSLRGLFNFAATAIISFASFALRRQLVTALGLILAYIVLTSKAFEGFAKLVGEAVGAITGTLSDLKPAFDLALLGFQNLLGGNGTVGILLLKESLLEVETIIGSNLVIAIQKLEQAFKPALDAINAGWLAILQTMRVYQSIQLQIAKTALFLSKDFRGFLDVPGIADFGKGLEPFNKNFEAVVKSMEQAFADSAVQPIVDAARAAFSEFARGGGGSFFPKPTISPEEAKAQAAQRNDAFKALGLLGKLPIPKIPTFQELGKSLATGVAVLQKRFPNLGVPTEDQLIRQQQQAKARIRERRNELNINKSALQSVIGTPFESLAQISFANLKDRLRAANQEDIAIIAKAQARLQAIPSVQKQQSVNLKDIVGSLVGDVQSTRLNRIRLKGEDKQSEAVDLLDTISKQLGGVADPYLKKIANAADNGLQFQ